MFEVNGKQFRIKQMTVSKQLALFNEYGKVYLQEASLEVKEKFYDTLLENIEFQTSNGEWMTVKGYGDSNYQLPDLTLQVALELQKKFVEEVFEPVFQENNAL